MIKNILKLKFVLLQLFSLPLLPALAPQNFPLPNHNNVNKDIMLDTSSRESADFEQRNPTHKVLGKHKLLLTLLLLSLLSALLCLIFFMARPLIVPFSIIFTTWTLLALLYLFLLHPILKPRCKTKLKNQHQDIESMNTSSINLFSLKNQFKQIASEIEEDKSDSLEKIILIGEKIFDLQKKISNISQLETCTKKTIQDFKKIEKDSLNIIFDTAYKELSDTLKNLDKKQQTKQLFIEINTQYKEFHNQMEEQWRSNEHSNSSDSQDSAISFFFLLFAHFKNHETIWKTFQNNVTSLIEKHIENSTKMIKNCERAYILIESTLQELLQQNEENRLEPLKRSIGQTKKTFQENHIFFNKIIDHWVEQKKTFCYFHTICFEDNRCLSRYFILKQIKKNLQIFKEITNFITDKEIYDIYIYIYQFCSYYSRIFPHSDENKDISKIFAEYNNVLLNIQKDNLSAPLGAKVSVKKCALKKIQSDFMNMHSYFESLITQKKLLIPDQKKLEKNIPHFIKSIEIDSLYLDRNHKGLSKTISLSQLFSPVDYHNINFYFNESELENELKTFDTYVDMYFDKIKQIKPPPPTNTTPQTNTTPKKKPPPPKKPIEFSLICAFIDYHAKKETTFDIISDDFYNAIVSVQKESSMKDIFLKIKTLKDLFDSIQVYLNFNQDVPDYLEKDIVTPLFSHVHKGNLLHCFGLYTEQKTDEQFLFFISNLQRLSDNNPMFAPLKKNYNILYNLSPISKIRYKHKRDSLQNQRAQQTV